MCLYVRLFWFIKESIIHGRAGHHFITLRTPSYRMNDPYLISDKLSNQHLITKSLNCCVRLVDDRLCIKLRTCCTKCTNVFTPMSSAAFRALQVLWGTQWAGQTVDFLLSVAAVSAMYVAECQGPSHSKPAGCDISDNGDVSASVVANGVLSSVAATHAVVLFGVHLC